MMYLQEFINENKAIILEKWVNAVIATYPTDASGFLTKQKDRFANPLGFSVTQGLSDLLQIMCGDEVAQENVSALDEQLIKLRAVQEFTPSEAVGFIYILKAIVFDLYRKEQKNDCAMAEWLVFGSRIDGMALMLFDMYMASRERIFQVRLKELTSGNYLVADRMTCTSAMLRRQQAEQAKAEKSCIEGH